MNLILNFFQSGADFALFITLCVFLCLLFAENTGIFYFCEQLTSQSEQIATIAYDIEWYSQPKDVQNMLIMITRQSQKPLALTAANFYDVNIMKYGDNLRSAYGYFNVLRNLVA